jgi:RNA polymerase sigma factor (sigma-70 family)
LKPKIEIHAELIQLCIREDSRAQYRLYKLYSKAMYNICSRMLSNQHEAEDVLQDAFVSAFRNLKHFKGNSTFGAWLKRIVINKCISQLRKNKPVWIEIEDAEIKKSEFFDSLDYSAIDAEYIHQAIKELPEGSRVVFNLFAVEGYRHKEIAKLLEVSESTSKSQYIRARSILMNKLSVVLDEN